MAGTSSVYLPPAASIAFLHTMIPVPEARVVVMNGENGWFSTTVPL